jgi:Predicted transcriptional regulators
MSKITLKAARVNKGWSQKEAAKRIGINVFTLGNYEMGKTFPDVPIIQAIEREYGLAYEDIIFLPKNYPLRVFGGEREG